MNASLVSVVMSVYNGAPYLRSAVESVLSQTLTNFELIVVNDGSTDGSREILAQYERCDPRVRVIDQENVGLTRSLIRGCTLARGEYIARQDADDVSLPGRLCKQASYLSAHPDVTLLSCWTQFIGPDGEELFRVERHDTAAEATAKLWCLDAQRIQGVAGHGSTMFRRRDYGRAGGYRHQFWASQDLDLWLRLTEFGTLAFLPETLYQARFTADCVSTQHHASQLALARIIVELARARQAGKSELELLLQAEAIRRPQRSPRPRDRARGQYFVGRCLLARGERQGLQYLKRAVRLNPFYWRAWVALCWHGVLGR